MIASKRRTHAFLFVALAASGCGSTPDPRHGARDLGYVYVPMDLGPRRDLGSPWDGGSPFDTGAPDAGCSPSVGSTSIAIHTVTWAMAGGTEDLGMVAVRAEGPCATAMELSTDAAGNLTLDLPNAGAPWSITMAKAGYAAVSIMDVTRIAGFDGDIRLDRLGSPAYGTYPVSGTVLGITAGNTATVDNYDFDTTTAGAGGAYSGNLYLAPAPNPAPPLQIVALELNAAGEAVNFGAATERARTAAPTSGVDVTLPSPAAAVITTNITIHFPTTGLVDGSVWPVLYGCQHALLDVAQNPYVLAGTSTIERPGASDFLLSIRHFGGPLDVNYTAIQFGGAIAIMNVVITDITDHEITVTPVEALQISSSSLGNFQAIGTGAGYDALIIHIGETEAEDPHWRLFADATSGTAIITGVPALPSSVSLADIGITGPSTSALPLYVRMQSGRAWSTQGMNQTIPQYAWAAGGYYEVLSTTGF